MWVRVKCVCVFVYVWVYVWVCLCVQRPLYKECMCALTVHSKRVAWIMSTAVPHRLSSQPINDADKRARVLDAEGLALGAQIATSKKRERDLIDGSFHRFANSEDMTEVPAWFVDDEKKHRKRPVPVTKDMVEEYKQKWKEINARPIRRVAEAKARKKRRTLKKMEQAKKKAEAVVNTVDISEREKMAQLKSIYKKAGVGKEKREVTYVVAKKGVGRRVRRPAGVKGAFKVVDGRMKKDTRAAQRKDERGRGKGGRGSKGMKGGRGPKGGRGMKAGKGRPNKK